MKTATPTPTETAVTVPVGSTKQQGKLICVEGPGGVIVAFMPRSVRTLAEGDAKAASLVHAINSHESLVGALEKALAVVEALMLGRITKVGLIEMVATHLRPARAVLAEAKRVA